MKRPSAQARPPLQSMLRRSTRARRRRACGPLEDRVPGRYLAAWERCFFSSWSWRRGMPATLGGNSVRIVGALAGILALASFGQMLDHHDGRDRPVGTRDLVGYGRHGRALRRAGRERALVTGALAVAVAISLVNGLFIAVLGLNALIVTLATFGIVTGAICRPGPARPSPSP